MKRTTNSSNSSDEDLLYAMQQYNLVYNYNFVNYSNQENNNGNIVYNHPDGWMYSDSGSGGEISYSPNDECCQIVTSSGSDAKMAFSQCLNEFPRWQQTLSGKKITVSFVVSAVGASSDITCSVNDGVNTRSENTSLNADEKTEIQLSLDLSTSLTQLTIEITSEANSKTINVYEVYANIGAVSINTLPCIVQGTIGERKQYMSTETPPANELSLCEVSTELDSGYTRLSSFLNGKFGFGENGLSMLPDMRGYFSRAWDNGATTDPNADSRTALGDGSTTGDNVGTVEQDDFKAHTHTVGVGPDPSILTGDVPSSKVATNTYTVESESTGGSETRPVNISELYTMKWA